MNSHQAAAKFLALAQRTAEEVYGGDLTRWWSATRASHPELYDLMVGDRSALANENNVQRQKRLAIEKLDRELRITTDYKSVLGPGVWQNWQPDSIRGERAGDLFQALVQQRMDRAKEDYNSAWRYCVREFNDVFRAMSIPIPPPEKSEAVARPDLKEYPSRGYKFTPMPLAAPPHIKALLANDLSTDGTPTHWSRLVPPDLISRWSDTDKLSPRGEKAAAIISALLEHFAKKSSYDSAIKHVRANYADLFDAQAQGDLIVKDI
jgi:hypothetical protein